WWFLLVFGLLCVLCCGVVFWCLVGCLWFCCLFLVVLWLVVGCWVVCWFVVGVLGWLVCFCVFGGGVGCCFAGWVVPSL
ncbi:hypothetical protein RA269_28135, partial [Pseudomonas syringae pv. tagetis]|uniref:hypothetical protein n=1 Tax=Pseudomonas syringae group genomosp. 7 TaxID=251699 RepID=UPI0037705778